MMFGHLIGQFHYKNIQPLAIVMDVKCNDGDQNQFLFYEPRYILQSWHFNMVVNEVFTLFWCQHLCSVEELQ